MQRTLLALALIVTAGASYAQTMPGNEPRDPYGRPLIGRNDWVRQPGDQPGSRSGMPANANMNTNAYGGATVTTAPSAQPGYAQPGYAQQPASAGMSANANMNTNANANMATTPSAQPGYAQPGYAQPQPGYAPQPSYGQPQATPAYQTGPRQAAFKDEYGFRYDSEGNRLDARGNVISPQTR
jgi:hypothetical protein